MGKCTKIGTTRKKKYLPQRRWWENEIKREDSFQYQYIKVMGERLASWLVLSLSKYPILSTQFILFLSFQWLLHIATSYYFDILMFCYADMYGRSITFLSPTHSWVFLSLLLIHFPSSLVFSIPMSNNLCTFTKTQESHKGIWVLSLKHLFKHVTHYTIPTQKTHDMGCPKPSITCINHTFWIQTASSAQIIASQMRMRTQQSSLLLVPLLIHGFSSSHFLFPSHLSPWSPASHSSIFPLPTSFLFPITHSAVGFY